ncbi:MAG: DUF4118 domain-containing protein [Chloroflexales bacterium]|nr:DUF4118 domain-containing protein [Chloroflexales bacterium]
MLAEPRSVRPSPLLRYGLALGASSLALLGTILLSSIIGHTIFPLFLAAVMVSAWYGGLGPGLLATATSAFASLYAFLPPRFSLALTLDSGIQIAVFLFAAILISALSEARRRSEAAAHAEREQYEVTLRSIGDGVIVTDKAGRITLMNPIAETLTGWSLEDARGQPIDKVFRIINEHTRLSVESPVARTLREGRVVGLANHTLLVAKDETERPIDDSGAPVRSAAGEVIGAVLVFRDIIARRAEEQAREAALHREQEARARAEMAEHRARFLDQAGALLTSTLAYEETLQAIARLAVSDIADLCVVYTRESDGVIRRVAAVHIDPERERELRDLQHTLIDPQGTHPAAQVMRTGQPLVDPEIKGEVLTPLTMDPTHMITLRALTPDSHLVVPLIARGAIIGAFSLGMSGSGRRYSATDVTLAQALAQRAALAVDNARLYEAAQAAIHARDRFLSLAAHELRTPLTAVLGNVQLLARRLTQVNEVDDRVQRKLQLIDGQLHRLTDMIATLLDISQLESGQLSLTLTPVDLCALARRVVEQAEGTLAQHTLTCNIPDLAVLVMGDALRLEQVLNNLLQNAVKYSPDGGRITVQVGRQHNRAFLAMADQGVGIPAEALPHLFERYYRAPDTSRHAISGMGIGLYVVREIVTLHGGTTEVTSAEGSGSTFTIWLPLQDPASAGAPPAESP